MVVRNTQVDVILACWNLQTIESPLYSISVYIRWLELEKMIEGAIETDNTSIVMPIVSDGHQDCIL